MVTVEEAREKKEELCKNIAELLNEYEGETGLSLSDLGIVRRAEYDGLGKETAFKYIVEAEVKI